MKTKFEQITEYIDRMIETVNQTEDLEQNLYAQGLLYAFKNCKNAVEYIGDVNTSLEWGSRPLIPPRKG